MRTGREEQFCSAGSVRTRLLLCWIGQLGNDHRMSQYLCCSTMYIHLADRPISTTLFARNEGLFCRQRIKRSNEGKEINWSIDDALIWKQSVLQYIQKFQSWDGTPVAQIRASVNTQTARQVLPRVSISMNYLPNQTIAIGIAKQNRILFGMFQQARVKYLVCGLITRLSGCLISCYFT